MCSTATYPPKKRPAIIEHVFAWAWRKTHGVLERTYGETKRDLYATLSGRVLEIGAGTGVNFQYFPKGLEVTALEPNPYMHPYLQEAAQKAEVTVTVDGGVAETISADDNTYDAVVSTLVLCSVYEPRKVVEEVHRVLKPGGRYIFLEHVAAPPRTPMRYVQDFLQPIWTIVADGCHPNRETWRLLQETPFSSLDLTHQNVPFPLLPVKPHIIGVATK